MSEISNNDFIIDTMPEPVFNENIPSPLTLERIRNATRNSLAKRKEELKSYPSCVLDESSVYQETTVSEKTLITYSKNANQLFKKWLVENEYDYETKFSEIDSTEFIYWLISRKPEWKAKTWRLYRQSVYMMLLDYQNVGEGNYIDISISIIQNDAVVRAVDSKSGVKKNNDVADGKKKENSSSLKYKKFPQNDLIRILSWLQYKSRSQSRVDLSNWIKATLVTGLRPIEWKGTDLVVIPDKSTIYGRRAYLHIICAKATNGRGFDVIRTLDLSTINDKDLEVVKKQSIKSLSWFESDTFYLHYRECADLLRRCCTFLWPRRKMRYSLYSCRHQAIANWKASGMTKMEIAILAGHASNNTAGESYGSRSNGWLGISKNNLPQPTKEQMKIAIKRQEDSNERILKIRKGSPGKIPSFNF